MVERAASSSSDTSLRYGAAHFRFVGTYPYGEGTRPPTVSSSRRGGQGTLRSKQQGPQFLACGLELSQWAGNSTLRNPAQRDDRTRTNRRGRFESGVSIGS